MLALDLGVFHKEDKIISVKEAFLWTGIWISVSLVFSIGIFFIYQYQNATLGAEKVLEYLTAYVVEKSLSLDNIFVMAAIFSFFKVPKKYSIESCFGVFGSDCFTRSLYFCRYSVNCQVLFVDVCFWRFTYCKCY
jgi:tellurite resistance protein TerC